MAIAILDRPEPLSEQSFLLEADSDPLVIDSESARLLRQELERYCSGTITGRSFLIAGHRGSGKTTLVNQAFLNTWKRRERGTRMLRPIYVPLHGPALFPDALIIDDERDESPALPAPPDSAPPKPVVPAANGKQAPIEPPAPAHPAPRAEAEAERALKQITLALHRAVSAEFANRFRLKVATDVERDGHAAAELAVAMESELYEMAPTSRLRQFWDLAGALEAGVLFANGAQVSDTPEEARSQGMRELLALSSILDAYRRISGDARAQLASRDQKTNIQTHSIELSPAAQSLVAPMTTVLTGGLAAGGFGLAGSGVFEALVGGIGAAFAAGSVFKWTRTRTRERIVTREDQFIFDLSVTTLDRILPVLIGRLRNAGLAPVFVVDELDKVRDLNTRILKLVHHLKKLVAENAFFCFITDRGYYEDIAHEIAAQAYGVQHSYFSQRVLVTFKVSDFDAYVVSRLPKPLDPTTIDSAAGESRQAVGSAAPTSSYASDDYQDWMILRWLLRAWSRLHALDLSREFARLRGEDGTVLLPAGAVRTARRFAIDLTMQVAIELTLDKAEVRDWVADAPDSRQALYDALYYLSREWDRDAKVVDLETDAGRESFARYLDLRTNSERFERELMKDRPPVDGGADAIAAWRQSAPQRVATLRQRLLRERLDSDEFEFLWAQVRALAALLSDRGDFAPNDPSGLMHAVVDWDQDRLSRELDELPAEVARLLLVGADESLLVGDLASLRFRYQHSGNERPGEMAGARKRKAPRRRARKDRGSARPSAEATGDKPWQGDVDAIRSMQESIRRLLL